MINALGWWCDLCDSQAQESGFCPTEGRQVSLCGACVRAWRLRAAAEGLASRCPLCADIQPARPPAAPPAPPAQPPPAIPGELAEAIDRAMKQEGLLIDVRQRVLRRLGRAPETADVR